MVLDVPLPQWVVVTYPDGTWHPPPSVSCCYIPRWYFTSPSLSELLSVTYSDGTWRPPPSVSCSVLHTQMVLHIPLPQWVVECYIPRWYLTSPSLSELFSVTYPDGTWCTPPSVSCSVLHTQMVLHIPLPQWVVQCYISRWYFTSPSLSELLLHTQMVLHIPLPQWVVQCYITRWYFTSPSLSELSSVTYPDGTSHPSPSVSCSVLHTQMVLHIPLPQWVVECYIPRWYLTSPSLSELFSVTYPDGTSHPPPSVSCWVLHTQMVLHIPLPQCVVQCYIPRWYFTSPSLSCSVLHTQMVLHIPLPQWVVQCYIPRWYFTSPSLSELFSVTYPDGTWCPHPSVSCWVLHTQMVLDIPLPQWVVQCYISRWYFTSPSLSELLSVTYIDGTSHPPPSVSCSVLHTQMVLHIPLPQWVVQCYIPRWYFTSPSLSELLSVTYQDGALVRHVPFPQWVDKCYIPRWYFTSPDPSSAASSLESNWHRSCSSGLRQTFAKTLRRPLKTVNQLPNGGNTTSRGNVYSCT